MYLDYMVDSEVVPLSAIPSTRSGSEMSQGQKLRSNFPETWLWDLVTVG